MDEILALALLEGPEPDEGCEALWVDGEYRPGNLAQAAIHVPRLMAYHISGSDYYAKFAHYNICVNLVPGNPKKAVSTITHPLNMVSAGTLGRNTGMLNISMICGAEGVWQFDANGNLVLKSKVAPIVDALIEEAAKAGAECCIRFNIDPKGFVRLPKKRLVGSSLVTIPGETIQVKTVTDHRFFAVQDGYPRDRFDVGVIMEKVYRKLFWYYTELLAGRMPFSSIADGTYPKQIWRKA